MKLETPEQMEFMGRAMSVCSLASKHHCSSHLPPLEVRHLELAQSLNVATRKQNNFKVGSRTASTAVT